MPDIKFNKGKVGSMDITKNNIVLIGFMGCGKSTIGKNLAKELGVRFIDTDKKIQDDMEMSINEIFEVYGEEYFRRLERNLCKLASLNAPAVIATGGGVIKDSANIDVLKRNGTFVYLSSTAAKIYKNIRYDNSRPLLNVANKEEKIKSMLEERRPIYEACSDVIVDVSNAKIDETVDTIKNLLMNN